jgi:hypothetical protein
VGRKLQRGAEGLWRQAHCIVNIYNPAAELNRVCLGQLFLELNQVCIQEIRKGGVAPPVEKLANECQAEADIRTLSRRGCVQWMVDEV